ncbi:MAG: hypothetical protein ABL998_23610, partial [Planctomycetota bacterium]
LFSAPVDGSAASLRLNASLPAGGSVAGDCEQVRGGRVVYRADQLTDEVNELFIVPADGSAAPLRLSGTLQPAGDEISFFAHDTFVLYLADASVDGREELYRVPLDGSTSPLALTPGLDVYRFQGFTRDGALALFSTYPSSIEERLYVVPTDGSAAPLYLAGSGIPSGFAYTTFWQVEPTGDGQRVVFQRLEDDGSFLYCDLWSARLDGTSLVQLNPGPRFAPTEFKLAPDGAWAAYVDTEVSSSYYSELVTVRTDGTLWRVLTPGAGRPGSFELSDDSVFCVFTSREAGLTSLQLDRLDGTQPFELLAPDVPSISLIDLVRGSTTAIYLSQSVLHALPSPNLPVAISGPGVTISRTFGFPAFRFTSDEGRILYRADPAISGVYDLFSAPVDASEPPSQLSPPLSGGRDVWDFRIAPDGRVLYRADQAVDDRFELFGVPVDGGQPAVRLNGALGANQDITSYAQPARERRPVRGP